MGNFEATPYASINLIIAPNYEIEKDKEKVNKEVGNFIMGRQ